jgi:hypothetical protein
MRPRKAMPQLELSEEYYMVKTIYKANSIKLNNYTILTLKQS